MTPTIATFAVCAAAEWLPEPLAAQIIDRIADHFESVVSRRAIIERAKAAQASVWDILRSPTPPCVLGSQLRPGAIISVPAAQPSQAMAINGTVYLLPPTEAELTAGEVTARYASVRGDMRRRNGINTVKGDNRKAAAYAAEEARLVAEFEKREGRPPLPDIRLAFEEIAREDPHMRRA